jgi:hypothetical protein
LDTLLRMQASYDIAQTRKREKQIHVKRFQSESSPRKCRSACHVQTAAEFR